MGHRSKAEAQWRHLREVSEIFWMVDVPNWPKYRVLL
jgi:hypothetical protein